MTDIKKVFLTCDFYGCKEYIAGDPFDSATQIRRRTSDGWAHRKAPQSEFQKKHNITPRAFEDFCPTHAREL